MFLTSSKITHLAVVLVFYGIINSQRILEKCWFLKLSLNNGYNSVNNGYVVLRLGTRFFLAN